MHAGKVHVRLWGAVVVGEVRSGIESVSCPTQKLGADLAQL